MTSIFKVACYLYLSYIYLKPIVAQYSVDTPQYKFGIADQQALLTEEVKSLPDTNYYFYPERQYLYTSTYSFDFLTTADYRIGILVDPCRFNSYNCCMNVFGTPEYPAALYSGIEQERVFKYIVISNETDISANYYRVYEDGSKVTTTVDRIADDDAIYDLTCVTKNVPTSNCQGRNYALERAQYRPPCMDNNQSLNAAAGCLNPVNGTSHKNCFQVGYTTTVLAPHCLASDGRCGTYLEIHIPHGSPYEPDENTVISELQLTQTNVSGYYTDMMPSTYMFNSSKILCSYSESVFRIGSLVYVQPTAPVCCCPQPFDANTRIGSFQCPIGSDGNGAFASPFSSLADVLSVDSLLLNYPFCPIDLSYNEDRFICSVYDMQDRRHFTRNCSKVFKSDPTRTRSWASSNLISQYDDACPYYDSCAKTLDAGKCRMGDLKYTFIGRVGVITKIDNSQVIPQAWVSFNNLRTSYQFSQVDLKLETTSRSMYELWWVVRSYTGNTVKKRKAFNVSAPACTFDTTNNRYFPYAILNGQGVPLTNSAAP